MLRIAFSILLWLPVMAVKLVLIVLGLVVVPLWMKVLRRPPPFMWQHGKNRPYTVWEAAIRNPVGGFDYLLDKPSGYQIYGFQSQYLEPGIMQRRFEWQFRIADDKPLSMFRAVWVWGGGKYGEFFLGWKLGFPTLDFGMSLRPYTDIET